MLRQKLLPAMLAILPATGALTAQTTIVEATTDPCRTRPGSGAPAGSHWYYRINRGDNHRCWYLSSLEARSARRGASVVRRDFISRRTRPTQHVSESEIDTRTPSAQMERTKAALALEQATVEAFAARWPDLPEYEPLDAHTVATRFISRIQGWCTRTRYPSCLSLTASGPASGKLLRSSSQSFLAEHL
jgi:hypothetical protein